MSRARDVADTQDNVGGAVAPFVGGKNALINGGFDIWQRGTSIASTAGNSYSADQWNSANASPNYATYSQQATNDTTNLANIRYCLRAQRNSGSANTGYILINSPLEVANTYRFAGKTITISFYARKGANFSASDNNLNLWLVTGQGTNDVNPNVTAYTGQAVTLSQTIAVTTSWVRYSYTVALSNTITQMSPFFFYQGTGTAGANDYFEITGVQIEQGSIATPFSRAGGSIGGELALCQRYYWRQNGILYTTFSSNGYTQSTTEGAYWVNLPVPMRVAPTSVEFTQINARSTTSGTAYTLGTMTIASTFSSPTLARGGMTITSGTWTIYNPIFLEGNGTSYIGFSAEL